MQLSTTQKRLSALVLVLLAGLGVIVYLAMRQPKSLKLFSSQVLAQNVQYPNPVDSNTVRFFTGTAVADLDLQHLTTKRVSQEFSLPRVLAFRWSKAGALVKFDNIAFETAGQVSYDVDTARSVWWYFDYANNRFVPLTSSVTGFKVVDAVWQGNDKVTLLLQASTPAQQILTTRKLADLSAVGGNISTHDLSLVGTSGQSVIAMRFSDCLEFVNNQQRTLVGDVAGTPAISDGLLYFRTTPSLKDNKSVIKIYSLADHKVERASLKTNSTIAQAASGVLVTPTTDSTETGAYADRLIHFVDFTHNVRNFSMEETDIQALGSVTDLLSAGGDMDSSASFLVANSNHELLKLSTNASVAGQKSSFAPLLFPQVNNIVGGTSVTYDGVRNELDVYFESGQNTPQARAAFDASLAAQKKDPNQVSKAWYTLQTSDLDVD